MFDIHGGPGRGHGGPAPHHEHDPRRAHRHPGRRGGKPDKGRGHGGPGGFGPGFGGPGFGGPGFGGPGFGGAGFGGPGFGGPGGPRGRGHRRGPGRRSRGDVRTAVLALLREESMHGYQIIQEITERSAGAWRPSPGSVYPTVSQLADEGLVHTEKSEGRSVVHLTEEGRRHTEEHAEELDAVWSSFTGDEHTDEYTALHTAGRGLAGALAQVTEVGTAAQIAEATRLLDETRRGLYLLLAGDEPDAGTQDPTEG